MTKSIKAGDVVIAHSGETHGVLNTGTEPLIFISVVAPALSGYELLDN
jgi:mannose-6-phosphate isomerase-like protein (cupin superfamily)